MSAAYDPADIKARFSLTDEVARNVKLKRSGREMVGLCPFHQEKSPSFYVVEEKGWCHCFGCGWHGDLIDYVADYHRTNFVGACEILDGTKQSSVKPLPRPSTPVVTLTPAPIPDDHERFNSRSRIRAWNPKRGEDGRWSDYSPDDVYAYEDHAGALIGYILRIDISGTGEDRPRKFFVPLRTALVGGKPEWCVWAFDEPRPLYGLPRIDREGPVFLTEGERKADVLAEIMDCPVLSWCGGTNGPPHTDFSPLRGRNVVVWADADEVGDVAAIDVAIHCERAGAETVRILPWDRSKPAGWDAADAVLEGWDADWVWDTVEARGVQILVGATDIPTDDFDANPFTGELPPPRQWAFGRMLLNRTVTALAAPAGTGKTTWATQVGIAFSQHIRFGPFDPIRTGKVWIWNNEDDADELNRRTLAACTAMSVDPAKLAGRLFINSGADRALIVAREDRRTGMIIATPDVARVIEVIKVRDIKLLIVDPFSETFEVESENSNDAMKRVAKLYRDIAWQTGCCVLLVVHTPKGTNADRSAGDLDAIRGGGAIGGVVRGAWTMFEMTETDAELVGIPMASKHLYVRLDNAKANMSLKDAEPIWWRKESIALGNGDNEYPEDIVGALVHQQFAPLAAKKEEENADILDRVSREIIRVCEAWSWTSADRAEPLAVVVGALDRDVTKLSPRFVTDLIIGQMGYSHRYDDSLIMVTQERRGTRDFRKIHIERK